MKTKIGANGRHESKVTQRLLNATHLLMANTCIYPWLSDYYLTPSEHIKEFSQAFYAWKEHLEKGSIVIDDQLEELESDA